MDMEKYVQVTQTDKGVFLNLQTAKDVVGLPDFMPALVRHLLTLPVENLDQAAVREAVGVLSDRALVAPPQPERKDGRFVLLMSPDGLEVQLSVIPPMPGGKMPEITAVLDRIRELGASDFLLDQDAMLRLLRSTEKTGFTVVGTRVDMQAKVDIGNDWIEASLTLTRPHGGLTLTVEQVIEDILAKGIAYGLDKAMVAEMVAQGRFEEPTVVARGVTPVEGRDAWVEYTFDIVQRRARPTMNEDGTANMRELNLIESVPIGTVLARKTPPTQGVAGKNLRGQDVPVRDGKDVLFAPGRGTDYNPNNPNEIVAAQAGQPKLAGGRVTILPLLEIKGDVDFGSGNVSFLGDVRIHGNVLTGFSVKASGDVEIGGVVESASVEAGGNIMIKAGVVGQGQAVIHCKQNLSARYLDSAKVFVDQEVNIEESVLNCELNALGTVKVMGKKGAIIGGVTRAARVVQVRQLGGPVGTNTRVEVGGSPKIFKELEEMDRLTKDIARRREEIEKTVAVLKKQKERDGELSFDSHQKFITATRSQFLLLAKLKQFQFQREALRQQMEAVPGQRSSVEVHGKCHGNVTVVIRNAMLKVISEQSMVRFVEHDDVIEAAVLSGKG